MTYFNISIISYRNISHEPYTVYDILYKHVILKQLLRNGLLKIPIPNLLHIMLLTWLDSETLLSYSAGQTKMNPDLMLPECGN